MNASTVLLRIIRLINNSPNWCSFVNRNENSVANDDFHGFNIALLAIGVTLAYGREQTKDVQKCEIMIDSFQRIGFEACVYSLWSSIIPMIDFGTATLLSCDTFKLNSPIT